MNTITRLLAVACLALSFAACKKEEAPKAEVAAPLSAPTTDDVTAWRAYVNDVATRNMDGVTNSPFVYFLPGEKSEVGSRLALPITKVTAMVSPSARPSPSMMPPMTPFWV